MTNKNMNIIQKIESLQSELDQIKQVLGIAKPQRAENAPKRAYKRRSLGGKNLEPQRLAEVKDTLKTLVDQTSIRSVANRARVSYGTIHRTLNTDGGLRREAAERILRLVAQPITN